MCRGGREKIAEGVYTDGENQEGRRSQKIERTGSEAGRRKD